MQDSKQKETDKEAISNWEDEGGALKPVRPIKKNNNAILVCAGILISLPLFYWLNSRR